LSNKYKRLFPTDLYVEVFGSLTIDITKIDAGSFFITVRTSGLATSYTCEMLIVANFTCECQSWKRL